MKDWKKLADKNVVEETITNLLPRGINAIFVETGNDAKEKVLEIIPKDSRVLVSSSVTLETTGIKDAIDESEDFVSVRKEYMSFDHESEKDKIRISRSTPEYILTSVHAVTLDGQVVIASNTGSQLAGIVSGAEKVIWIVGTQKIVEDLDEGIKRLNEYVVPLEDKHMQSLYGVRTNVSKLLIFNKEIVKGRVTLIFVNEAVGF